MNKLAGLTAVVFGLSAAIAVAQSQPEPSPLPKAPPEISAESAPPPPKPPSPRGEPDMRSGGPEPDMGPGHHRPPPPKAAHFRVMIGDARIDLKCADGDSTEECGEVLLKLFDRLQNASVQESEPGRGFNRRDRDRDRDYNRDRDDGR